jgi:hypothetical protein
MERYPALTKYLLHSSGEKVSMIEAMRWQASSMVLSLAVRSQCFSFEKACSMGLRSGL